MNALQNLSEEEEEALLKFPVYVSLLAANAEGGLDKAERKSALQFSHIKTYSCHPSLREFYKMADKEFEHNLVQLDKQLPKSRSERTDAIKTALARVEKIIQKLDAGHAMLMHNTMRSFKDHVSRAHHNVLEDFIFPLPIKGINEQDKRRH
jgi:hypothetical protein